MRGKSFTQKLILDIVFNNQILIKYILPSKSYL